MFEKDNVDFFYGNINNQDIKKQGEAVKKVVSLKEACRLVSDFLDKKEEYILNQKKLIN